MSDPTLEEESLISQDDIDKLLDASSIEEAEKILDAPEAPAQETVDEMGELSQDDIDSLLGGKVEEAPAELSQDDIDNLFGGPDESGEEMELISQEDIDRLMNPSDDSGPSEDPDMDDDDELISMDDIQGLLNAAPDEKDPGIQETQAPAESGLTEPPGLEPRPKDQDVWAQDSTVQEPADQDPLDQVITGDEAMTVGDCLITQETLDRLLAEAPQADGSAAAPLTDEDSLSQDLIDLDIGAQDFPEPGGDLDSLFAEEETAVPLDLDGETEGDVTQADIDALLQESDDDEGFLDADEDILISQDDIDTLLMAADQEDEDVLGDLLGEVSETAMDDDAGQDLMEEARAAKAAHQVVLEGEIQDTVLPAEPRKKGGNLKSLVRSKWVLAAASVLLIMGITIPAAYFLFFSGEPVSVPGAGTLPLTAEEAPGQGDVASITVEEEIPDPVARQSGTMVLADFIILASDLAKDMTYIYADIAIDYSDQRAYHEISSNLSFYRDLIYEAIQASLVSDKRNEVTQADLIWGVETSLKKVLPPHFIEKISFKTFRTS